MPEKQSVSDLKADFMMRWCGKVQQLVAIRRSKMTQSEIAFLTGRSLKTIQRFENYKCLDPELMFIYNRLLMI